MILSKTQFVPFSQKQLSVLTWWCDQSPHKNKDAIICDGAVRSGKTLCMSISFVLWAFYRFEDTSFAICGKTIASLKRNVVTPILPQLRELGFVCEHKVSKNVIEISKNGRTNRFYIFGGKDESSASLIQGMTLGGVLLDEVALMPRSFVEQALARCSLEGSKFWFNCNPENPHHWFFDEWIKKAKHKNCLYLHFLMEDNPSLSKEIISRYKSLYSGAFYERFVLGKWVAAQGLVYPFFSSANIAKPPTKVCEEYYISCDYGTVNPASFGLWGRHDDVWYRLREYYFNSREMGEQKTDEEYYIELENLAGECEITTIFVDPSAASFIECIRRHEKFCVTPAKNDVQDGIRKVSDALKSGKIKICDVCVDTIKEFSLYRWNDKASGDVPRKENDHAMDDIRYFVSSLPQDDEMGFACIAALRQ
ncbi:MAG: PBSX family phage terminase large subunit [Clostridiales bacterium]|jgi:PBSX family phage terminase large subunit|nr:PBSX family phage terminase large subunit [Clostridiales bacterium]